MSNLSIEEQELRKFHQEFLNDIRTAQQAAGEEGATQEQIFTEMAEKLLSDAGETENVRLAFDERPNSPYGALKINGYAVSENYETLDLLVACFNGQNSPGKISKEEVDKAAKKALSFFKNSFYKSFSDKIDESSEVFEISELLSRSRELKDSLIRANVFVLTDDIYVGNPPKSSEIAGVAIGIKVVDLNYLYNIAQKPHVPIQIDFQEEGFVVPCVVSPQVSQDYQTYLAIISGDALATLYQRFGARLLQQNVRSFLQFAGKVNKGIRNTILKEPEMFLAYNNGIAATAEGIELGPAPDGEGQVIRRAMDLQIVNGGQTTASIFYTQKKDKAKVSGIFVQVKLTVVKNKDKFGEIVARIAEYANTQNKVSVADLSSNTPFHVQLEKLSRTMFTPAITTASIQTRWFYERARGQYKNARIKEGFTPAKQRAFESKNPKAQVFTKEDIAKYIHAFDTKGHGKKQNVGPHLVVRGNQKNYAVFIQNLDANLPDSTYFEDLVAKAILFKTAEKLYGIKPNAIGDIRFIAVPYAIAYLSHKTEGKLSLFKIWKNQHLSPNLRDTLLQILRYVNDFLEKNDRKQSLLSEWVKKEECWSQLKAEDFAIDWTMIAPDLIQPEEAKSRSRLTDDEHSKLLHQEELRQIISIGYEGWKLIEKWGRETDRLTHYMRNQAYHIAQKVRSMIPLSVIEQKEAQKILDILVKEQPDLLQDLENTHAPVKASDEIEVEITMELVKRMVAWDKAEKKFNLNSHTFIKQIANGEYAFGPANKEKVAELLQRAIQLGFKA